MAEYKLTEAQKKTLQDLGNPRIAWYYMNRDIAVDTPRIQVIKTDGTVKFLDVYMGERERITPGFPPTAEITTVPITTKATPPSKKPPKEPPRYYQYKFETVCMKRPELCKPREIHHVAWDADNTIWDISAGIASSVTGPLKKINEDTVVVTREPPKKVKKEAPEQPPLTPREKEELMLEEWWRGTIETKSENEEQEEIAKELLESLSPTDKALLASVSKETGEEVSLEEVRRGKRRWWEILPPKKPPKKPTTYYEPTPVTIKLLPTFRQTLDELERRGITSSVISLNTKGSVKRILEEFGLADRFAEIRDSWENKGKVFNEQAKDFHICPCNILFLDDTLTHVENIHDKCGLGLQIGKDKDIEKPIDILKYIKD